MVITICSTPIHPTNINHHDIYLVIGDFNSRLGHDSHDESLYTHNSTNNNGERLLNFCLATNLRHAQSRCPHPIGQGSGPRQEPINSRRS